ncbi:hypothetical protein XENTR_v10013534 [Xenopus tropicalis]|nr:hypothetical protein XENTR_v10013534 [Xenopus tropicalis]
MILQETYMKQCLFCLTSMVAKSHFEHFTHIFNEMSLMGSYQQGFVLQAKKDTYCVICTIQVKLKKHGIKRISDQ